MFLTPTIYYFLIEKLFQGQQVNLLLLVMPMLPPFRLHEKRPVDFLASLIIGSWEVFFTSLEEGGFVSPVFVCWSSVLAILRSRPVVSVTDVALIIAANDEDGLFSLSTVDESLGSSAVVEDFNCVDFFGNDSVDSNIPSDLLSLPDGIVFLSVEIFFEST